MFTQNEEDMYLVLASVFILDEEIAKGTPENVT